MRNTELLMSDADRIKEAAAIEILSGEGEVGTREPYTGPRTVRALRARLTRERVGGDRWAVLLLDGERV